MKKLLLLLCAVTLIFGMVGTANALSFSKSYNKDVLFNKDYTKHKWTFDLDKLKRIDPEDTIKSAEISIKFGGFNGPNDEVDIKLDGSSGSNNSDVTALVTDHKLIVKVIRDGGRFRVKKVKLSGEYWDNSSSAPVPEPATILMMGVGLLGLVGYSRKRFSKKR